MLAHGVSLRCLNLHTRERERTVGLVANAVLGNWDLGFIDRY